MYCRETLKARKMLNTPANYVFGEHFGVTLSQGVRAAILFRSYKSMTTSRNGP